MKTQFENGLQNENITMKVLCAAMNPACSRVGFMDIAQDFHSW